MMRRLRCSFSRVGRFWFRRDLLFCFYLVFHCCYLFGKVLLVLRDHSEKQVLGMRRGATMIVEACSRVISIVREKIQFCWLVLLVKK